MNLCNSLRKTSQFKPELKVEQRNQEKDMNLNLTSLRAITLFYNGKATMKRKLVMLPLALVGLIASSATPARADNLNYGVSCTARASIIGDFPSRSGNNVTIVHGIKCNRAVEQIIVYGTDYKEGFQSTSTKSQKTTCYNANSCYMVIDIPVRDCPRGWYITRTSGDVGQPGNQRYYGSVLEVRQRTWWDSFCYQ